MDSNSKKISLKLLVDMEKSKVVLAEANDDFVDILLSFLTMPLGTITRLLQENSPLGCIANLYASVEHLDSKHLQTEACKSMLLDPLNAAERYCENLVINVHDTKQKRFYTCKKEECCSKYVCRYSSVQDARCFCGKKMSYVGNWLKKDADKGAFIKGGWNFIVTDDLQILPATTSTLLSLLDKLGVKDRRTLDEKILDLGPEEIMDLLHKILSTKAPLTNLCFAGSAKNDISKLIDESFLLLPKSEGNGGSERKEVKVKLLLTENENRVVHMEGSADMADSLFSFLTLPLGAVIKLLEKNSSIGCVDNLYNTAAHLTGVTGQGYECFISEQRKQLLLSPMLPPFFSCKDGLLEVDEALSGGRSVRGCYACFRAKNAACIHGVRTANFTELNPKLPNHSSEPGGGFAKGPCNFVVTDDLKLAPVSPLSTVGIINELELPISDLVEKEVSIGQPQALNVLKAALRSERALTTVFCPGAASKRPRS